MEIIIIAGIAVIAFFYSSAGYGGATGYLALMALLGVSTLIMKPSALFLNVIVSSIAFFTYYKAGYFRIRLILPFAAGSVPLAFIGGSFIPADGVYRIFLGIFLIIASFRIFFRPSEPEYVTSPSLLPAFAAGASIGLFSGMIGIGGGILLSPLLILMRWARLREAAAASSLFILLNSLSGLAGFYGSSSGIPPEAMLWSLPAIAGGIAGSYCGSFRFPLRWLKVVVSCIIVTAGIYLII